MRIGIVFHKNPFATPNSIDLVRLRAIAFGLVDRGIDAEVLSPAAEEGTLDGVIPVRNIVKIRQPDRYDVIKTCYHDSILLVEGYRGPVVSRIVRVVDSMLPKRDESARGKLLRCQDLIRQRASVVALNNPENATRWRQFYGDRQEIVLVPTGCPSIIPARGRNPYPPGERIVLFLGSIAAPRMVDMLNEAARMLDGIAVVHLVGKNKVGMYAGSASDALHPLVREHGEVPDQGIWDYICHADVGLALATGPHPFDNDVSKVLYYLRGGLPVLSEEPIVNNDLLRRTGYGRVFRHGDPDDLVGRAKELLTCPLTSGKESVMDFMAANHSWESRASIYADLFKQLIPIPMAKSSTMND